MANIIAAIGTLALATAAFFTIRQNQKQLAALSRQINLQRSSLVPYLEIRNFIVQENELKLDVENLSNSIARGVGISTSFYLVFPRYSADPKGNDILSRSRLEQRLNDEQMVYVKYYLSIPSDSPRLYFKGKEAKAVEVVSFPETGNIAAYFPANHTTQLVFHPRFMVNTKEQLPSGMAFKFEEFKEFLLQNNIDYCAVDIQFIYQDLTETQIGHDTFLRFVINSKLHKSLQECCEDKSSFDFLPLSIRQIQLDNKWIEKSIYKRFKSPWNRSEEEMEMIRKLEDQLDRD